MARTVIVLNNPTIKLADTEAGLTSGTAFECQITSATLTASANYQTIPATGCAPQTQSPGKTSWSFDVAWLQDWTAAAVVGPPAIPAGGLSQYAFTNDGLPKWFEFVADNVGSPTTVATGQVYIAAGSYGGTFGDGSAAVATSSWPCVDTPDISSAGTTMAAAQSEPVAA
jgi:hypothetical protein